MSQFWPTALLTLSSIMLSACGGSNKKSSSGGGGEARPAARVTYEGFIKDWLDERCTSCHTEDEEEPDLTSYALAKKNAKKILKSIQNEDDPMPPEELPPASEVAKVKAWVDNGMPEGSSSSEDDDPSDAKSGANLVTYDDFVEGWLKEECVSCHKPGRDDPDLSTYALAKENIQDIIASISDEDYPSPMPPGRKANNVDEKVLAKLEAWKKAGMPKSEDDPKSGKKTSTKTSVSTGTATGTSMSTGTRTSTSTGTSTGTTTSTATATVAQVAVTYESFARAYLTQKCTSCHSPNREQPDLSTYATARAGAAASLRTIDGTGARRMPPSAVNIESVDIIRNFQAWIQAGTPER